MINLVVLLVEQTRMSMLSSVLISGIKLHDVGAYYDEQ